MALVKRLMSTCFKRSLSPTALESAGRWAVSIIFFLATHGRTLARETRTNSPKEMGSKFIWTFPASIWVISNIEEINPSNDWLRSKMVATYSDCSIFIGPAKPSESISE